MAEGVAAVPALGRYASMADNGVQLIIVSEGVSYIYTPSARTIEPVIDGAFPQGCTSVAFIDQYFIVPKPGSREFYVSALLDGLTWNVLGVPIYATKENSSDPLVAVEALNGVLVLFGSQSIEFWQDVGVTGTQPQPFQRINQATQQWGLAALHSRAHIGNSIIFLGTNSNNALQVIKLNGYTPQRVSNSDVERLISQFTTWTDAIALTYMVDGHSMYQLTFPTENRSILYDDITGFWYETQTGTEEVARHIGNLGIAFNTKSLACDSVTGVVYVFDSNTYTDVGYRTKRQVTTRHIRNEGNVVTLGSLYLDFETGVGAGVPATFPGYDPMVMLRISRDGGHTFGNERWKSLGKQGNYLTRVMLRRLGSAEDFVVQITTTDPVKFVLASGSAVIESGDD